MRYECFHCDKEFDELENNMCPHCHSTNWADKKTEIEKLKLDYDNQAMIEDLWEKQNEIIDYINKEECNGK